MVSDKWLLTEKRRGKIEKKGGIAPPALINFARSRLFSSSDHLLNKVSFIGFFFLLAIFIPDKTKKWEERHSHQPLFEKGLRPAALDKGEGEKMIPTVPFLIGGSNFQV